MVGAWCVTGEYVVEEIDDASLNERMLSRLNGTEVTADELLAVVDASESLPPELRLLPGAAMFLVARMYRGNFAKASAVIMRMSAVAELLAHGKLASWTVPVDGVGALAPRAVYAAAAAHPLSLIEGQVSFEPESFATKVLELAQPEGRA